MLLWFYLYLESFFVILHLNQITTNVADFIWNFESIFKNYSISNFAFALPLFPWKYLKYYWISEFPPPIASFSSNSSSILLLFSTTLKKNILFHNCIPENSRCHCLGSLARTIAWSVCSNDKKTQKWSVSVNDTSFWLPLWPCPLASPQVLALLNYF
jgi:hypothetical protein